MLDRRRPKRLSTCFIFHLPLSVCLFFRLFQLIHRPGLAWGHAEEIYGRFPSHRYTIVAKQ